MPPTAADRTEHRNQEALWVAAYLEARRKWLKSFGVDTPQHVSAYRCDTLLRLVQAGNWRLNTPLDVVLPHKTVSISRIPAVVQS